MDLFHAVFGSLASSVREINRKYAKPTIEITPFVRACLLTLRVYLFLLIGLMLYKFVVTVQG